MIRSRSPSRSPPDASTDAFSSSLTTTVFSQRSMRWLEASLRRATPKGHETFIFRTAPHQGLVPTSGPPCVQDTPRHPQCADRQGREPVGAQGTPAERDKHPLPGAPPSLADKHGPDDLACELDGGAWPKYSKTILVGTRHTWRP